MNDVSRMQTIKSRIGLTIKTRSTASSEYIRMKQIQREVRERWLVIKSDFEAKYEGCKDYDYIMVLTFIESLATLCNTKLHKLHQTSSTEDGIESYLLGKMGIKKDKLVFKNTTLTQGIN